jgi:hypothetical protein
MSVGPWSGASSAGPSGVRGAARAHCPVGNRRGPSAWPVSGKDQAYKPMVKSLGGQQESECHWGLFHGHGQSEGAVVPLIGVRNSPGGKGPCFDHTREAGKCEGMTGSARSISPGGSRPCRSRRAIVPVGVKVRQLQRALWVAAKRSEGRRTRRPPRRRNAASVQQAHRPLALLSSTPPDIRRSQSLSSPNRLLPNSPAKARTTRQPATLPSGYCRRHPRRQLLGVKNQERFEQQQFSQPIVISTPQAQSGRLLLPP